MGTKTTKTRTMYVFYKCEEKIVSPSKLFTILKKNEKSVGGETQITFLANLPNSLYSALDHFNQKLPYVCGGPSGPPPGPALVGACPRRRFGRFKKIHRPGTGHHRPTEVSGHQRSKKGLSKYESNM